MSRLIDSYDAALCDLDGVVYLGPQPIAGAAETIRHLQSESVKVGFVTNNAGRPAQAVVDQLRGFDIECAADDVVTSGQAGANLLAENLPAGAKVLVTGSQALRDEVSARGLTLVTDHTEDPDAVIQGYDPQMTWPRLESAVFAIAAGARWFACNLDSTRPTDKGLVPGTGAQVGVVATCIDGQPEVAGKPHPPLLNFTMQRLATSRPIFVGDRLDTDIEGANNVGIDSLHVFTGSHGKYELAAAAPLQRPTAIGYGLDALLKPARQATLCGVVASCAAGDVQISSGKIVTDVIPGDREAQLDLLWAGLQLIWQHPDVEYDEFLASLDELH